MFEKMDIRVQATAFIWLGFVLAIFAAAFSGVTDDTATTIVIAAAIAALVSTGATWRFGSPEILEGQAREAAESGKRKRGADSDPRTALLLQLMDADERQELKHRLMDDLTADGEDVSLAALLDDEGRSRSGR